MCNFPFYIRRELEEPQLVPCGQCTVCKRERARQWAVRITHEAQMHNENCFITLTYNNKSLPKGGNLSKRDFQLFMKRFRRYLGDRKVRYYACGEYGDNFSRPHYHAIIFGYDFKDKEKVRESHSKYGKVNDLYTSITLENLWKKGFVRVGEVSMDSANYVARYVIKKINGDQAREHYKGRVKEFSLMSKRPGIGKSWYDKYKGDVYPKDYFHIEGVKHSATRYYDDQLKKEDVLTHEEIKVKRREKIVRTHPVRAREKEKYARAMLEIKKRRFESET